MTSVVWLGYSSVGYVKAVKLNCRKLLLHWHQTIDAA